jgi:hypothetical protein
MGVLYLRGNAPPGRETHGARPIRIALALTLLVIYAYVLPPHR